MAVDLIRQLAFTFRDYLADPEDKGDECGRKPQHAAINEREIWVLV